MDNNFMDFVQEIFNYLRSLPFLNDHYDKLIVILGALVLLYFVGSMIRSVLIGAVLVFLLWGFRYQDIGDSQHINRYTGAVCDATSECWQPEKFSNVYDRSGSDRPRHRRSSDDRLNDDRLSDDRLNDDRPNYDRPSHDRSSYRY